VVYVDLEMTAEDVRERLTDMGYGPADDLSRLHYYQLSLIPPLDTMQGGDVLMAIVGRHQAELVVLDTMARVVAGDENSSDTDRDFFRCTGSRLKAAGVGLLRLDHAGKDITKGQRGSSGKNDDIDIIWRMAVGDDRIVLHREKTRVSYVPAEVTLTRETDPVLRHVLAPATWPAGTAEVAGLLDDLGVAIDASSTVAATALTKNGTGRRKAVILSALKYRRGRQKLREPVREPVISKAAESTGTGFGTGNPKTGVWAGDSSGDGSRNRTEPPGTGEAVNGNRSTTLRVEPVPDLLEIGFEEHDFYEPPMRSDDDLAAYEGWQAS
jgi:hypothetical protein